MPLTFVYLCWCVVNRNLDGLAGLAHVDHHQNVSVTDLRGINQRNSLSFKKQMMFHVRLRLFVR